MVRSGSTRLPRLYFGTANHGFVGRLMAKEFRRRGYHARWQLYKPALSQDDLSTCLHVERYRGNPLRLLLLRNFLHLALTTDIFHFSYYSTLLTGNADLPILQRMGKQVCMRYVGSDIRVESSDEFCDSEICRFGDCDEAESRARSERFYRLYDLIDAHILIDPTTFPSSRMYPRYYPEERPFHFLPSPVDVDALHYTPCCGAPQLTIVHIPSHHGLKGTRYVVEAFEYLGKHFPQVRTVLLSDLAHAELIRQFTQADIVVDQLGAPFHGITSLEAMALGKVVVSRLNGTVLETIRSLYPIYDTPVPPIVPATPGTIAEVLVDLIRQRDRLPEIGLAGRRYVETYHNVEVVADRLAAIYESIWKG